MSVSTATREPGLPRTTQAEGARAAPGLQDAAPYLKAPSWATGLPEDAAWPRTQRPRLVQGQEKPGRRAAAGCSMTLGLGPKPWGSDGEGRCGHVQDFSSCLPQTPESRPGTLLLQGAPSWDKNKRTPSLKHRKARIAAAAVGIFIKKENILDLVLVHVSEARKSGGLERNTSHVPGQAQHVPLCAMGRAGCGRAHGGGRVVPPPRAGNPVPSRGGAGAKDTWAAPSIRAEALP